MMSSEMACSAWDGLTPSAPCLLTQTISCHQEQLLQQVMVSYREQLCKRLPGLGRVKSCKNALQHERSKQAVPSAFDICSHGPCWLTVHTIYVECNNGQKHCEDVNNAQILCMQSLLMLTASCPTAQASPNTATHCIMLRMLTMQSKRLSKPLNQAQHLKPYSQNGLAPK